MSKLQRRTIGAAGLVATVAVLVMGVFIAGAGSQAPPQPVREISLEARGVAFNGVNPTLEARVGEKLRIVVRNNDPGVLHSIAVPALGSETREVRAGEGVVLEVDVDQPGTYEYVCPRHGAMMKGTLIVRP